MAQLVRHRAQANLTLRRLIIYTSFISGIVLLWVAHAVFLLVFAGLLFGIFLEGLTRLVSRWTHLKHSWSLTITVLAFFAISFASFALLLPGIIDQLVALQLELPQAVTRLEQYIGQYQWGRDVLQTVPNVRELLGESKSLFSQFMGALSTTISVAVQATLVVVIGIYLAAEPEQYSETIVRLFARRYRERVKRTLHNVRERMWWWLISVGLSALFITILTYIGLRLLGIPLALSLAILTGLLAFIPNFGHILSAIPPTLLALMAGPVQALLVILLFFVIQFVESNVLTPLLHRKTIRMLPVIGVAAQLTFGLLFGFMGLLLADPLMATVLVILESVEEERDKQNIEDRKS